MDQALAKVAAEKLLRSVLPEDLHIRLAAIGECEVQGKSGFTYVLKKGAKTHCKKMDGTVHSCCIELSDTQAPDTDRIVAEYLLIISDEQKYLKTANLTQIGGVPEYRGMQRFRPEEFELDAVRYARIGDTVTVRRPPRYVVNRDITPIQVIAQELFRLVFSAEHLDRPFPDMGQNGWQGIGTVRDFNIDMRIPSNDITLPIDQMSERYLRPAAMQLQEALSPMNDNLIGFLRREVPRGVDAGARVSDQNRHLQLMRTYEIMTNTNLTRATIFAVVAR